VFLRNSDREVDYAASFLGDGRQIIRLTPGRAIIHNSTWGAVTVQVRPPLSKVWELSDQATRSLLLGNRDTATSLSEEAARLIEIARDRGPVAPLNLAEAGRLLGITSKRRLHRLVDELEEAGVARTRKLRDRGQPRIIEAIASRCDGLPHQTPDGTGSKRETPA
jgi:hypothetical protein